MERFRGLLGRLGARGTRPPRVHAANSSGTLNVPGAVMDWVRVGLMAYGHQPPNARARLELRQVMSFKTRLVQVRSLAATQVAELIDARERALGAQHPGADTGLGGAAPAPEGAGVHLVVTPAPVPGTGGPVERGAHDEERQQLERLLERARRLADRGYLPAALALLDQSGAGDQAVTALRDELAR